MATVLGSWCSIPDAIPHDKLIAMFRDKAKHLKGKEPVASSGPTASASSSITVDSD
jgi:hypothetical protein